MLCATEHLTNLYLRLLIFIIRMHKLCARTFFLHYRRTLAHWHHRANKQVFCDIKATKKWKNKNKHAATAATTTSKRESHENARTKEKENERRKKYEFVMANRSSAAINYSRHCIYYACRFEVNSRDSPSYGLDGEMQCAHSLQSHILHWTLMQSNCYCKLICHCDMSRALAIRCTKKEEEKSEEEKEKKNKQCSKAQLNIPISFGLCVCGVPGQRTMGWRGKK